MLIPLHFIYPKLFTFFYHLALAKLLKNCFNLKIKQLEIILTLVFKSYFKKS